MKLFDWKGKIMEDFWKICRYSRIFRIFTNY